MKNRKIVCQSDIRLWNFCEEKKQMLRKKPASTSAVSGSGPAGTQTSQRKPWKPGFPPPYPHTLPRPVIGTLHVSSANSNTSSVFTPMCHSWTGTGIRTGRCMCPPPGGKAGCTGSHQGRERSGTMTWPCALCTVCTPPESPFLESVQTSCLFFAAMHCNAWPALVRFPN